MHIDLQVAIDLIDLDRALKVASEVHRYVDRIEVGTPLIKKYGLSAVKEMKKRFPDRLIVADMKTMDTGYLETALAFRHGADISTVLGVADSETVRGALKAAEEFGGEIYIDTIGIEVDRLGDTIQRAFLLGARWFLIHVGIDEQRRGEDPISKLRKISDLGVEINIGVAGGLNKNRILHLRGIDNLKLVIVGSDITLSDSPDKSAREIRYTLDKLF
jgi:3-hexulose-6-phosphate synthase/6-phospho-3-hexuloisomerase